MFYSNPPPPFPPLSYGLMATMKKKKTSDKEKEATKDLGKEKEATKDQDMEKEATKDQDKEKEATKDKEAKKKMNPLRTAWARILKKTYKDVGEGNKKPMIIITLI